MFAIYIYIRDTALFPSNQSRPTKRVPFVWSAVGLCYSDVIIAVLLVFVRFYNSVAMETIRFYISSNRNQIVRRLWNVNSGREAFNEMSRQAMRSPSSIRRPEFYVTFFLNQNVDLNDDIFV